MCGLYEKIKQKVPGKYLLRGLFISFISNKKQKQRSCSITIFLKIEITNSCIMCMTQKD